eukprot:199885_1
MSSLEAVSTNYGLLHSYLPYYDQFCLYIAFQTFSFISRAAEKQIDFESMKSSLISSLQSDESNEVEPTALLEVYDQEILSYIVFEQIVSYQAKSNQHMAHLLQSNFYIHLFLDFYCGPVSQKHNLFKNLINKTRESTHALDIVSRYLNHDDVYYAISYMIDCGLCGSLVGLMKDIQPQIMNQSVSKHHRCKVIQVVSIFTYWQRMVCEDQCPDKVHRDETIQMLVSFCYEGGQILKWALNGLLNLVSLDMYRRYGEQTPYGIFAQIIPVLKWCLITQQRLKYVLNLIDVLLFLGDKHYDNKYNPFAQDLSNDGFECLLRAMDGDIWNKFEEDIYRFSHHDVEYREFINDFEGWRDRVLYEYFGGAIETKEMLLVFGYVHSHDVYIEDIIKCIAKHVPQKRRFQDVSSDWRISKNKTIITLEENIQNKTQFIYFNGNGYDSGVHFLAIKSRRYPYCEDSFMGVVSEKNMKWVQNANELFSDDGTDYPILRADPSKCYFFTPERSDDCIDGFDEGDVAAIRLDCDHGIVSFTVGDRVEHKKIEKKTRYFFVLASSSFDVGGYVEIEQDFDTSKFD